MKHKKSISSEHEYIKYLILLGSTFGYIIYSEQLVNSVVYAISVCTQTLIPTLFLPILLSNILSKNTAPHTLASKTHFLINKLFGLSGNCINAIFSGLLLGYNSSYINALTLYENKVITLKEAQRLALLFNGPGIAFCLTAVGITLLNSFLTGFMFLIAGIMSSLLSALILNILDRNNSDFIQISKKTELGNTITAAIKETSQLLLTISSWVILFCCLKTVISNILPFANIKTIMEITGEVISGLSFSAKRNSIFLTGFCLFFGGFCIFFQQLPLMKALKIHPLRALLIKIVTALMSSTVMCILNMLFPVNSAVFSYNIKFSANNSFISSVSLIILVIINISVFITESKKLRHKKTFLELDRKHQL